MMMMKHSRKWMSMFILPIFVLTAAILMIIGATMGPTANTILGANGVWLAGMIMFYASILIMVWMILGAMMMKAMMCKMKKDTKDY